MVQRLWAALPASWLPAGKQDSNLMAAPTSLTPVSLLNCTTPRASDKDTQDRHVGTHCFGRPQLLCQGTMSLLGDSQSLLYQLSPRHHLLSSLSQTFFLWGRGNHLQWWVWSQSSKSEGSWAEMAPRFTMRSVAIGWYAIYTVMSCESFTHTHRVVVIIAGVSTFIWCKRDIDRQRLVLLKADRNARVGPRHHTATIGNAGRHN